jgi:hypothetical protein
MNTIVAALLPLLIVLAIFLVIYRSVRGKKSTKLKSIGWLELLIAYLCVIVPIGLIMSLGKISPIFEKVPGLSPLSTFDFLTRLVLILASFYGGVCLWKTSKTAVKKAKIILAALLVFNVFVVRGVYSLAIYAALASANVAIPARAILDALMKDITGSIVTAAVVVSWYIYLNRSQRVREIYGTPAVAQPVPPETKMMDGDVTPSTEQDAKNP